MADHGEHPVFRHQRQRAGNAEPDARQRAAFLERVEIGQHDQRQRQELQQIGVIFESLEVEDRIEREHHHDKKGAAPVDHPKRDQPRDHEATADHGHRQRVGGPIGHRKDPEPDAGDPAGKRRMLAVAELEFLAPGERLCDVHVNVLCRLQIDQDQRPQHRMRERKAGHQP